MTTVAAIILLASAGFSDLQAHFHHDFRAQKLDRRLLRVVGDDDSKLVKQEDGGLRAKLAFAGENRRVSVVTRFRVRGDFEITATFEILEATTPTTDLGRSGISVEFTTDTPTKEAARLSRMVDSKNTIFIAGRTTTVNEKRKHRGKREPVEAVSMTFRLARRGSTLHYFVAEGESTVFREVHQEEIGTEDLPSVRLLAMARGPKSSIDVLWKQITIRADALPGLPTFLWTVDDERLIARSLTMADGTLSVGGTPPRRIALDEVARIVFNNAATLKAGWIGQDNRDLVGPGPNTEKNGIQDIHVSLTGLDPARRIKQLVVLDPKQQATWKLDSRSRLLATFTSDEIANGPRWQRISHARAVPAGTAMIRVRLISRRKSGKNNDGYFDALSLKAGGKSQNLLTNPGNEAQLESGKIPGWTAVEGNWTKRNQGPKPREGAAYFFAGEGERAELRQDVDVTSFAESIAAGKQRFVFDGYVRTWPSEPVDTSQIVLEYHQAENATPSKLALRRRFSSDRADLYLEPAGDHFGHTMTVEVTYTDGTTALAITKATTHTDSKLKRDEKKSKPRTAGARNTLAVTVALEAGDLVRGNLVSLTEEALTLDTPWQTALAIPLVQVLGIQFGSTSSAKDRQQFQKLLESPGPLDTVLVRGADQAVTAVKGGARDLVDGKLRFTYEGEIRSINQTRLSGLVLAAHPAVRKTTSLYQVFRLVSGAKVSGSWSAIDKGRYHLRTQWGSPVKLPARLVAEISSRNGKLVYLSDLEPASVREVAYFGRLMRYRRDRNLLGKPLQLGGKTYSKGVAVHSRCVLTYSLDGQFTKFKSLVGFDDTIETQGHVSCRVLGDSKELFAEKLSGRSPVPLDLSIVGVDQLTLEIDFGKQQDTGDRVIWANARVLRK